MQIPAEIRKCVAFLAVERNSGKTLGGTAFFVFYDGEGYLVTAGHVIEDIRDRMPADNSIHVRINLNDGRADYVQTRLSDWVMHDDPRVDLAALSIGRGFERMDHSYVPAEMFLTSQVVAEDRIGPGDELFFPGLFKHHHGIETNIPILRTGAITSMLDERVLTSRGAMRAYLAEARSIGGFSGSPVFVFLDAMRQRGTGAITFEIGGGTRFYLFGVVHGHFGVNEQHWDSVDEDSETEADSRETRSINMGIAIVVPADEVIALLNQQVFIDRRTLVRQAIETTTYSTLSPDVGPAEDSSNRPPA